MSHDKMAAADEDLEFNYFYQSLQTQFRNEFASAQERCYLILVPMQNAIATTTFDQRFVETHILRPSPYFKGQYQTTDRGTSGSVEVDDGKIVTLQGFSEERNVQILSEETGYNTKMKPFKILLIDKPLIGNISNKSENNRKILVNGIDPCEPTYSLQECHEFLLCFDECQKCLFSMKTPIKQFRDNYLLLEGYMDETVDKIKEIYETTMQKYIQVLNSPYRQDARVIENIKRSLETYLMSLVFDKIWPVICAECLDGDSRLSSQLKLLSKVSQEKLGIRAELCCPLTAAVLEICKLGAYKTPLEKLMCMKQTLDIITETVTTHLMSTYSNSEQEDGCLSSDDLLPLLVSVLSQSSIPNLSAHILLSERFHWSSDTADGLSYSLVTFRAAVEYVIRLDVRTLLRSRGVSRDNSPNQTTPEPGSSVTVPAALREDMATNPAAPGENMATKPTAPREDVATKPAAPSDEVDKETPTSSRKLSKLEKQMERISRMTKSLAVEERTTPSRPVSSRDWHQVAPPSGSYRNKHRGSHNRAAPRSEQLGDFLSSLQNDSLPSYGKQS